MPTVEDELKELKAARDKVDAEIAGVNKTLQDTQAKLGAANGARSSLQTKIVVAERKLTELKTTKEAGKAQRDKVTKDLADAQAAFDDLQTKLTAELPAERRTAIGAAIAKIDGAIDDARVTVAAAQKQASDAETAANDAKQKATAAEAESQKATEELRQWPKQVEAARTKVTKLAGEAKAAHDAGRLFEAYLRIVELKTALAALPALSSQATEDKLTAAFADKSSAAEKAASDAAKAADTFSKQKATQATAEAELKKKEQSRAGDLKAVLSSLPLTVESPSPPLLPKEGNPPAAAAPAKE
jgi:chromosome segregation ATPase